MTLPELYITIWPTFPHFKRFASDYRLSGLRLNSAMLNAEELPDELMPIKQTKDPLPLYFDIKGRQLRIKEIIPNNENLELILNHSISVNTPTVVLFKGGEDYSILKEIKDGNHLIFDGGPQYILKAGESLHIKDPTLEVTGNIFCDYEIEKIKIAKQAGFKKWFLSYVQSQEEIDEFRNHIGDDKIVAKIENKKGLEFVAEKYKKQQNLNLMAACGDLYIEIDKPHHMMEALKTIINNEPEAFVGSRMLLSLVQKPIPKCADLLQLAWLKDIGYKKMMLCDELCLKEELLSTAINVFESFKYKYCRTAMK